MELSYLNDFLTLAETRNYLEAAAELYISQSVLSKHIQKLENELGVSLFVRTTKKVQLSKYGELYLPYARQMLNLQADFDQLVSNDKEEEVMKIEIGSVSALAPYNITTLISEFKKLHQDISLNVTLDRSSHLFKMLLQKKCDLAFIREAERMDPELEKDFIRIPYASDILSVVLPVSHPLASRTQICLSEVKNEKFLFLGNDNMPYHLCHNACLRSGFEPDIVFTNRYPETLIELVQAGMGVALLMKPLALFSATPGVSVVDVTPAVSSYLSIFYLKDKRPSRSAQLFLDFIKTKI